MASQHVAQTKGFRVDSCGGSCASSFSATVAILPTATTATLKLATLARLTMDSSELKMRRSIGRYGRAGRCAAAAALACQSRVP